MSKKRDDLIEILVEYFYTYKSYDLCEAMKSYGLIPDETLNPNNSKRIFAKAGIKKLSDENIEKLALRITKEAEDVALNKKMEKWLKDQFFEISFVTRRKLADFFDTCTDLEGRMRLDELLEKVFDIDKAYEDDSQLEFWQTVTVREFIKQHVIDNNDISYKDMLLDILEFKYVSDQIVKKFLEIIVDPEIREKDQQDRYVNSINEIIKPDNYELVATKKVSGELIYRIHKICLRNSNTRNLIFAPLNKKPDIVIEDAIDNDLKIAGDTGDCLFYTFGPNSNGLSWSELVEWWKTKTKSTARKADIKNELFVRLRDSLDSEAERIFFKEYYMSYKDYKDFPALIPQVYLHYDPFSKNVRGNSIIYMHQRMDFLMLLPDGIRIIFEIDGKQHYSKDEKAAPELYAEMVTDTRNLMIKGYEVYRFGGYEFIEAQKPKNMINNFFNQLFAKYSVVNE